MRDGGKKKKVGRRLKVKIRKTDTMSQVRQSWKEKDRPN